MLDKLRELREQAERVNDGLHTVLYVMGVFLFGFVAALMLASKTNRPTGNVLADIGLWMLMLGAVGFFVLRSAKWLRQSNFGDVPPSNPPTLQDLAANLTMALCGPLLLIWYVPHLLELPTNSFAALWQGLRERSIEALLAAAGLLLIALPLRAYMRYIGRR